MASCLHSLLDRSDQSVWYKYKIFQYKSNTVLTETVVTCLAAACWQCYMLSINRVISCRSKSFHVLPTPEREMFYLTTHSTHFFLRLYGVIWLRTILIVRKETRCRHICYSYRLTAMVFLYYATSHRQDNTYRCLCYTRRGALAGTRNSSMGCLHHDDLDLV